MPRVNFVEKARKDNPVAKKGESYYWWKFRYGGKHYSKTRPKPSQLTQSPYLGMVRGLMEQIDDFKPEDASDLESLRDEIAGELESLRDETQDNLDNMPEGLQEGDTGQMLQERIDACENAASELQNMDFNFESELDESADEEERAEELQNWLDEQRNEMESLVGDCDI